jgi:hypothetical protein
MLVQKRFTKPNARNVLDDWKSMHQSVTVQVYLVYFEQLRSRLLLEGHKFFYLDYIDVFMGVERRN